MNSKALREKRAELVEEMKLLKDKLTNEKRSTFSEQELEQYDNLDRQQEEMIKQAETLERCERIDGLTANESRQQLRSEVVGQPKTRGEREYVEDRNKAYAGWFFRGTPKSKAEYLRAADRAGIDLNSPFLRFDFNPWVSPMEQRTGQVLSPTSAGGFTVAVDNSLMTQLDVALKFYGNVLNYATVVNTETGASLPWPNLNDTTTYGEVIAEQGTINQLDLTFGQQSLTAKKFDSGFIKLSWELLQDSILDLVGVISNASGQRLGRKLNKYVIYDGTDHSGKGVMDLATAGATNSSVTTTTYAKLNEHYFTVDPDYRNDPSCGWVWCDSTQQVVEGLVDTTGRPLLTSSLDGISGSQTTGRVKGKPVFINQEIPALGANNKVALFGALNKIIVRRVTGGTEGGFVVQRLNELFAATGMVGYLTWMRADSTLADAGSHPLKYILCPAS